jgi:hypothetical protein
MNSREPRDKIFISYSHKDGWWLDELVRMLTPLSRTGKLLIWSDKMIPAGNNWKEEIDKALSEVRVAVLAVSDHFMHSEFINRVELPNLLLAAQEDEIKICWCLLSACIFEDSKIGSIQAAHDISRSFDRMSPAQRKQALKGVAQTISSLYDGMPLSADLTETGASFVEEKAHSDKTRITTLAPPDLAIVELTINRDFDNFSQKDQKLLLQGIAQLLKVSEAEIRIRSKRRGSVILNLELPIELAKELLQASREGKLQSLGVISARPQKQGGGLPGGISITGSDTTQHTLLEIPSGIRSLLARHDMLLPLTRQCVIAHAVTEVVLDDIEQHHAWKGWLQKHGIYGPDQLQNHFALHGMTEADAHWQAELPIRIQRYCEEQFLDRAEQRFLTRKRQLDTVTYSLLRVSNSVLANELFHRITEGETDFAELASIYSEGPEKATRGKVGPVPLLQAHPALVEKLRNIQPGVPQAPININNWWLVIRLEHLHSASFDEAMQRQMTQELFEEWVHTEVQRLIMSSTAFPYS